MLVVESEWTYVLFLIEACFNFVFTAELVIKLIAFWSLSSWATDNFPGNLIDAAIIIVSDITFILSLFASSTFNVNIFRLVRIMRAFRLVSRFRRLRLLFNKAYASFKAILNVLFVLIFWHVLGSLLGMQIFRWPPLFHYRRDPILMLRAHALKTCPPKPPNPNPEPSIDLLARSPKPSDPD